MFEVIRAYFEREFPLTEEQFELFKTLFIPKNLEKGDFLLREGEIAKYGAFVARGCLRSYVIDSKGRDHILQFAPENWWLSDLHSITNKVPSVLFIDAIENSDVLLIDAVSFQRLVQQIPAVAASFQAGLQKHTSAKDNRIITTLASTAEERYNDFLNKYPSIATRVPQHMLASYLGITPETLSRIRKQRSRKK